MQLLFTSMVSTKLLSHEATEQLCNNVRVSGLDDNNSTLRLQIDDLKSPQNTHGKSLPHNVNLLSFGQKI